MRILVVEDEAALRQGLVALLGGAGHAVTALADGPEAVSEGIAGAYELVILDLMLPSLDGLEVCRRLREGRPGLPVLMLTARASEDDVVRGLLCGADDYVTKPFGARELLARVDAIERRSRTLPGEPERLEIDGCILDLGRLIATRGESSEPLTPREAGILRWLYRHRSRVVSRAELLEHVWSAAGDLETRTVDMTIAKLRRKIEREPASPRIVVTVTGAGYAWGDP
jgi:two-component system, OmpR family, response regulator RegX3